MAYSQQRRRRPGRLSEPCVLLAAALLLGAFAPGCNRPEPSQLTGVLPAGAPLPNVLFILIDTLRADRIGPYGHSGGLMPLADDLAREGVTFEHCVSAAPWTLPSVASIFTSYYPSVHKTTRYVSPDAKEVDATRDPAGFVSVLPDSEFVTLAEAMQRLGYYTLGVSANRFVSRRFGFAQGFEAFDDDFDGDTVPGELVNQSVFRHLAARDAQRPLFLYVHYMDVHGPYNAPPQFMDALVARVEQQPDRRPLTRQEFETIFPYLRVPPPHDHGAQQFERLKGYWEYWQARYEAGIAAQNHYLEQLRDHLRQLKLWDDAYILFLADHGESLCEHGMWDHGHTLYEPEIHVPLILRWPGVLPAGRRVSGVVRTIDILPTLLEQLRAPVAGTVQGISLAAVAAGRAPVPDVPALSESLKGRPVRFEQAVVRGEWKLLRRAQLARTPDNRIRFTGRYDTLLYNLASNVPERVDVAPTHRQVVQALDAWLMEQNRLNDQLKPDLIVTHAAAPVDKLAGLGYAGALPGDLEDEPDAATQPTSASAPASRDALHDPPRGGGERSGDPAGRSGPGQGGRERGEPGRANGAQQGGGTP